MGKMMLKFHNDSCNYTQVRAPARSRRGGNKPITSLSRGIIGKEIRKNKKTEKQLKNDKEK
jgi:hypothetical protein